MQLNQTNARLHVRQSFSRGPCWNPVEISCKINIFKTWCKKVFSLFTYRKRMTVWLRSRSITGTDRFFKVEILSCVLQIYNVHYNKVAWSAKQNSLRELTGNCRCTRFFGARLRLICYINVCYCVPSFFKKLPSCFLLFAIHNQTRSAVEAMSIHSLHHSQRQSFPNCENDWETEIHANILR